MKKYDFNTIIKLKSLLLRRNHEGEIIISPFPLAFVRFVVYLQCYHINTKADGCLQIAGIFYVCLYSYSLKYSGCLIPCGDVNALPTAFGM